ncbi:MAG TPA: PIN domain-containing protein [Thermomicrobiales bacterium]|nr:PIN domain-containing protein [Thermomicrobiales bacterium]
MTSFVDTNIFIRLLTQDDAEKSAACLALFKRAESSAISLSTSESVIAEVVYVLSSPALYRISRPELVAALSPVIASRGLEIEHKASILRALERFAVTRFDFEDCLSVEHVKRKQLDGLYSYDRDFDRMPEVQRLEP